MDVNGSNEVIDADVCRQLERMIAEIFDLDQPPKTMAEMRAVLERHAGSGVHTCHANCQRPVCAYRRALKAEQILADQLADALKDFRNIKVFNALEAWKKARQPQSNPS